MCSFLAEFTNYCKLRLQDILKYRQVYLRRLSYSYLLIKRRSIGTSLYIPATRHYKQLIAIESNLRYPTTQLHPCFQHTGRETSGFIRDRQWCSISAIDRHIWVQYPWHHPVQGNAHLQNQPKTELRWQIIKYKLPSQLLPYKDNLAVQYHSCKKSI